MLRGRRHGQAPKRVQGTPGVGQQAPVRGCWAKLRADTAQAREQGAVVHFPAERLPALVVRIPTCQTRCVNVACGLCRRLLRLTPCPMAPCAHCSNTCPDTGVSHWDSAGPSTDASIGSRAKWERFHARATRVRRTQPATAYRTSHASGRCVAVHGTRRGQHRIGSHSLQDILRASTCLGRVISDNRDSHSAAGRGSAA